MNRTLRIAGATLALSALALPANARATTQRVLMRGASNSTKGQPATNAREHVVYGRIEAIRGNTLVLRTRAGKAQLVDAGEAIRTGSYSEPLFVGKIVVVTGTYAATRTLRASSVMRMGSLDAGTPADR